MKAPVHEDSVPMPDEKGAVVPFLAQPLYARQALLLAVTSDLISAAEPGELSRVTFERISSAFSADSCFSYCFDPVGQRPRLVFGSGIPPQHLVAARSINSVRGIAGLLRQPTSRL
jgi:hypothetical protein